MVLQPLLGSAELLSYIRTNETILSLVSSTCLLRNTQNVSYLCRFLCVFYAVFTHRSGIQFAFQRAQDHNIPSPGSKVP